MDPLKSKVLKGRFQILDLAAETATGLLFKGRVVPDAECPGVNPGAQVFIKIVADRAQRRDGDIERYTREVAATARLGFDRHFVRYLDVDVIGGRLVVVTLVWPSRSLAALMQADQRISYPAMLRGVRDLTQALFVARTEGVADRHVRADDLLIDPETGEARILRLTTPYARTVTGLSGLPEPGETSDLVCVGTMLYRMAVLSEPFTRTGEGAQAESERLASALKLAYAHVTPAEVARVARMFEQLVAPSPLAPALTYAGVAEVIDALESDNEDLTKSRARLAAWKRRRSGSELLQTAFDTVAAMRGEIKAPAHTRPEPERKAGAGGKSAGASGTAGLGAGVGTGLGGGGGGAGGDADRGGERESAGAARASGRAAASGTSSGGLWNSPDDALPDVHAPLSPAEQAVLIWSRIDLGPTPLLGDMPYLMGILTLSAGCAFLLTLYWLVFR